MPHLLNMSVLFLIGIGTGNPDHLTGEASKAIAHADLILIPHKGPEKSDLADLRHQIVLNVRPDAHDVIVPFDMPVRDPDLPYLQAVEEWHDQIAKVWADKILQHPQARNIALLVWGDPSLYDSTLRIAERLHPMPEIKVVPGITSLQALTAAHAIALNTLGGEIVITTGRRLRDHGWPHNAETVAVMLDGKCAFQMLKDQNLYIWWGAYLGMPQQILSAGPLRDISQDIIEKRTKAREKHGWIMDIYLLRKLPV